MARGGGGNTMADLEHILFNLCRCIIYFEAAFEVLLPAHRCQHEYTKGNRVDNPRLSKLNLQQCYRKIDGCLNNADIADLMNNGGDRYYGWNFVNLYYNGKTTAEFRRSPGVKTAEECYSWVDFAMVFVHAAIIHGSETELGGMEADVKGLKKFMGAALVSGIHQSDLFKPIFQGKSGLLAPKPLAPLNSEQLDKLKKKINQDEKKNIMVKKFLSQSHG